MSARYVAILDHDPDSGAWGIVFPDFPGCISAGPSYEAAVASGAEALAAHVSLLRKEGDAIQEPRTLEDIMALGAEWVDPGSVVAMVPVLPPTGRKERINITFDARLLSQIDEVSRNRSAFLEEAARRVLSD